MICGWHFAVTHAVTAAGPNGASVVTAAGVPTGASVAVSIGGVAVHTPHVFAHASLICGDVYGPRPVSHITGSAIIEHMAALASAHSAASSRLPRRKRGWKSEKLLPKDGVPHVPDLQTSLVVLPSPPPSHGVPSRLTTFWQLPFLQVLETVHCFWRPLRLQSTPLVLHRSSPTHSPLPAPGGSTQLRQVHYHAILGIGGICIKDHTWGLHRPHRIKMSVGCGEESRLQ